MNLLEKSKPLHNKITSRLEVNLCIDRPLYLNKRELEDITYPKPKVQEPIEKPEKIKVVFEENKDGFTA